MNFVARVEENLRDLGTEARRKHPGVKEASERAILTLRTCQTQYVAAVRRATSDPGHAHPTTALFRSQDVLRPFLLAANYPDASARILNIALGGIELLLEGDAVCEGDEMHIVRVLGIQAGVCCDTLSKAESSAGHGGMTAGVGAAGSAAAGAVGAVIGGNLASWGMFGGSGSSSKPSGADGGGGGGGIMSLSSPDDVPVGGMPHCIGSSSGHVIHSARNVREDEAAARRILRILGTIVASPGLGLTEEVFAQCLTVCLMLLSCGSPESISAGAAIEVIVEANRARTGSRPGQSDVGKVVSHGSSSSSAAAAAAPESGRTAASRIRRLAASALQNIIMTLFKRTSAALSMASNGDKESSENWTISSPPPSSGSVAESSNPSDVHSLAVSTLLDLCALASPSSDRDRSRQYNSDSSGAVKLSCLKDATGPLANALQNGGTSMGHRQGSVHPPARATCLWILDSLLKERVDLFDPTYEMAHTVELKDGVDDFPSLLRSKACPIVTKTLLGLCSDTSVSRPLQLDSRTETIRSKKDDSKSNIIDSIPESKDLALLLASTSLARTIVSQYGSSNNLRVAASESEKSDQESCAECHTLISCLVRLVVAATESIRDTEGFEDGYVYDQVENEILSASRTSAGDGSTSSSATAAPSSGGPHPRPKKATRAQSVDSHHSSGTGVGFILPSSRPAPIPPALLWGAALSLETLHGLTLTCLPIMSDLLANVVEAASDFAAVGGSCADSIKGIVAAAANDSSGESITAVIKAPCQIFSLRAKELVGAFDDECDVLCEEYSSSSGEQQNGEHFFPPSSMALLLQSGDLVGDAVWIAYKCILLVSESLKSMTAEDLQQRPKQDTDTLLLIDGSFSPSLAAFQHFMKRFPGSTIIVSQTVAGYEHLANALIPCVPDAESIQRRALLTSLCKLSIPSWGKNNNTSLMKDHHITCLDALFGIIHRHHDELKNDWYIILCTMEYLASLSISSTALSDESLKKASLISSCFTRLPPFTTCLSDASLKCFIEALVDVSSARVGKRSRPKGPSDGGSTTSREDAAARTGDEGDSAAKQKDSAGMTGRLFSLAGRAFGGGSDPDLKERKHSFDASMARVRISKTYAEEFCDNVYTRLAATKPTTRKDVFQSLPFSLVAMTDVALSNSFRFGGYGPAVTSHLHEVALTSASSEIRLYAIDTLTNIVTAQLSNVSSNVYNNIASEDKPHSARANAASLMDYLCVDDVDGVVVDQDKGLTQADLLAPLCGAVKGTDKIDTAEAGLNALHGILEGSGHNLSGDAWLPLINAISALSGHKEDAIEDAKTIDRSLSAWSTCGMLGFRCLKLIVDDFLDELPSPPHSSAVETRSALLDCCAAFGSSQHDVNTSLTSTGMLWTIADQDLTPDSLDHVLSKLALLSFDGRVEVRNCSVNTLFSCVVGLGDSLSPAQWRVCLSETLFGVMEEISSRGSQNADAESVAAKSEAKAIDNSSNRYKVTVHHSRDSSIKQWATTQVLALRGLERVLRQFFPRLLQAAVSSDPSASPDAEAESNWLEMTWARSLESAYYCATLKGGRETLDLRVVGADLLVLCAQLSSEAGIASANTPAKVGTNMQVINGALRSVKQSKSDQASEEVDQETDEFDDNANDCRRRLFTLAFESVEKLCANLEHQSIHDDEEGSTIYVESTLLQVLTKLSGGLTKLYECCKENEMAPPRLHSREEGGNNLEFRMVQAVAVVMKSSVGDPSSKYLTQSQRACLDLLKTMSLHGSFVAFEQLSVLGASAYYHCKKEDDDSNNGSAVNEIISASQSLEFECAKVVVDIFLNDSVDPQAKLHVFDSMLGRFIQFGSQDAQKAARARARTSKQDKMDVRYDYFLPIVSQGLDIAASSADASSGNITELGDVWKKVLSMLFTLLVPDTNDVNTSYFAASQEILVITKLCIEKLPEKFNEDVGVVLAKGAENAAKITREQSASALADSMDDEEISRLRMNGLKIFQACFGGLCESQPTSDLLISLSETLLKEAVDGAAQTASMKEHSKDDVGARLRTEVDIQVALFVCESIRKLSNLEQVAITLFPWLCKLTRSDSAALRTEAGTVLSSVDMVGVIQRAQEAEERAAVAEKRYAKLLSKVAAIKEENEELKRQAMLGI